MSPSNQILYWVLEYKERGEQERQDPLSYGISDLIEDMAKKQENTERGYISVSSTKAPSK